MFLYRQSVHRPLTVLAGQVILLALALGCGGATRTPQKSAATLTAASVGSDIERVLIAEKGSVAMVARDGCVATIRSSENEVGSGDELRVRCPRAERIKAWFDAVTKLTSSVPVDKISEEEDVAVPAAELVTSGGGLMRLKRKEDTDRLIGEVNALAAELAAAEVPEPGPASPAGWQMLRVTGPAHVVFAGSPTRGMLEARVSTNGQYYCEFVAHGEGGPLRATKSGFLTAATAVRAIDEVLVPFAASNPGDSMKTTFAAATKGGNEHRANEASTAAVFERFVPMQDALGDACLPELEAPITGF